MRIHCSAITVAGRRHENQDAVNLPGLGLLAEGEVHSISCELTETASLIALADGVGGRPEGRWAARLALETLCSTIIVPNSESNLATAISNANSALDKKSNFGAGPATTLAGLSISADTVILFHIGDSRIYNVGQNSALLLTSDHRSRTDGRSITRYLGSNIHAIPTMKTNAVEPNLYLIATDGFYAFLQETDFLLLHEFDFERALPMLVDMALQNGSDDNLTAIAIKIECDPIKLP